MERSASPKERSKIGSTLVGCRVDISDYVARRTFCMNCLIGMSWPEFTHGHENVISIQKFPLSFVKKSFRIAFAVE